MFGMSMTEILVILAAVLVFLGPEKIPEAARTVGKFLREIRKASNLLRDAVNIDDVMKPKPLSPVHSPDGVSSEALRDPDPKKDVRVIDMTPRTKPNGSVAEFTMALASPEMPHREIYLHVPYEETI